MSSKSKQHPGRSAEFLSRLHDGELDPGERAHFEAHRAHCAECRRAALEFEDALSLFRSARSRPPQADLAGRILRKIQTSSRPRAPFGLRFRTDLGLVALLLTGIFAILLSTPIAVRREEPPVVPPPPPASGVSTSAPAAPAVSKAAEERDQLSSQRERRVRQALPPAASEATGSVRPEEPGTAPTSIAAERKKEVADARADEPDRAEPRPAFAAEPGRAGGTQEEESTAAAAAPASPLHLSIEAIDGYGSAPPLLSDSRMAMPAAYRGHEFILLVDSQGKVSEVLPGPTRKQETARLAAPTPDALSELRFKPGNRPRRLLLRFE